MEKEDENNDTKIIIDLASRARTVLAAVRRLEENDDEMQRKRRRRLRVLVLGADRNEGATDDETEKIFKACGEEIPMDVSLVGPNVPKDDDAVWSSSSSGRSAKEVRVAERERRLFHEKERGLLTTTKKEREKEETNNNNNNKNNTITRVKNTISRSRSTPACGGMTRGRRA